MSNSIVNSFNIIGLEIFIKKNSKHLIVLPILVIKINKPVRNNISQINKYIYIMFEDQVTCCSLK